jgi:hypothetical protein
MNRLAPGPPGEALAWCSGRLWLARSGTLLVVGSAALPWHAADGARRWRWLAPAGPALSGAEWR